MKKWSLYLGLAVHGMLLGQVVINEVSTSNRTTAMDEEGDSPDWIELYNSGSAPVNVKGYQLTDNASTAQKWIFPSFNIAAGGYLSVFASGKNRVSVVDHWESLVLENNTWKYRVPTASITSWTNTAFDDAAWSSGIGGLGYADADDGTTITPNPFRCLYARKTFDLVEASQIERLKLYMDYDDGFVAYLNGNEIARANMPVGLADFNTLALGAREATVYTGGAYAEFSIPYEMFKALLVKGKNVLAIQVHNNTANSNDLTMRANLIAGISVSTQQYQTLPSFFQGNASSAIHTDFKLSASGTPVILYDANGNLLSGISVPKLLADDTYGRFPNGSSTLKVLRPATFNSNNGGSSPYTGYWPDEVTFSLAAGFYTGNQTLTLGKVSASSTIRYTLDGSIPTASSPEYTTPLEISKNTVVRASCFADDYINGKVSTNTYFVNQAAALPVFSISSNPDNFFDENTGIYVDGPAAVVASCPQQPYSCRNYWQDWEREIHVEFFDQDKTHKFEQDAGVKILGGWSRTSPQKSMQLRAGDSYGKSHFEYSFFSEPKKAHLKKFETLTLRNGGNDYQSTLLRDAVNQRILNSNSCYDNQMDFEAYTPVVVFINGAYYGIHTLRERIDDSYFENNGGHKEVNSLEMDGTQLDNVKEGSNAEFMAMLEYIETHDLTVATNYDYIKTVLDIDNYIDYFCAELFHTNWDWPHNNIKFWKPVGNGKWRYIYHDTDFSYGLYGYTTTTTDELARMITDVSATGSHKNVHTPMLQKLLGNTSFRNQFLNRMADLLNTIYKSGYLSAAFDSLSAEIDPEIDRHIAAFATSSTPALSGTRARWESNKTAVKTFMNSRPANVRSSFVSRYTLGGTTTITLDVKPAGAGRIKISTIAPCDLPFEGVYFRNVPVNIEVLPNEGYVFKNWTGSPTAIQNSTSSKHTLTFAEATASITANFATTSDIPKITFSEINYQSDTTLAQNSNAGDWLELYNYGNAPMDISGWTLQDVNAYNKYVFPSSTTIASGNYLVVASDLTLFKKIHPSVSNVQGPLGYNLSNDGEKLMLIDPFNTQQLSVTYNDVSPWPVLANGAGATLELISPTASLDDPYNWKDGCRRGSPGMAYVTCTGTGIITSESDAQMHNTKLDIQQISENQIYIHSDVAITELFIYNPQGQVLIHKNQINIHVSEIPLQSASHVYIAKAVLSNGQVTTRAFLLRE